LATQAHAIPIKGGAASQPIASYNGIQYNGGPVMNHVNGVKVYFICYGNWTNTTVPTILTDFINHIGGSAYFNINTTYNDFNKFVNGVKAWREFPTCVKRCSSLEWDRCSPSMRRRLSSPLVAVR
jgi:hypothetical protein